MFGTQNPGSNNSMFGQQQPASNLFGGGGTYAQTQPNNLFGNQNN